MEITKLTKITIGLISACGICGAIGYGYLSNRSIIKDKLKGFLINKGEEEKWHNRIIKLSNLKENELSPELLEIKANPSHNKIEAWCYNNIENKFTSEKDPLLIKVERLCTYDIKDKISEPITEDSWNDGKNNKKLEDIADDSKLSENMKAIKNKLKDTAKPNKNALKEWCENIYEEQFKGNKEQNFLDAKEYCQIIK